MIATSSIQGVEINVTSIGADLHAMMLAVGLFTTIMETHGTMKMRKWKLALLLTNSCLQMV